MGNYDDMLDMPHHVSEKRTQMSMIDRGAQFSPFSALVGYDAAIQETARLTEQRVELTESEKSVINEKLMLLSHVMDQHPSVDITFFCKDLRKEGGIYRTVSGRIVKIDLNEICILMEDGTQIPVDQVIQLDSEWFHVF